MSRFGRLHFRRPAVTVDDLRVRARRKLPRPIFDLIDGGAGDEVTLRRNAAAFQRYEVLPHVLGGVSDVDTSTSLFGHSHRSPLILAPTGMTGLIRPAGEYEVARAARRAGITYCVSTASTVPVERIASTGATLWFQLYVMKDRAVTADLIARANELDVGALVVTVDVPVAGQRERDLRNHLTLPLRWTPRTILAYGQHPTWVARFLFGGDAEWSDQPTSSERVSDAVSLAAFISSQFDPTLTWSDIEWVRAQWPGALIVKGLLRGDDAAQAIRIGADGVIVSNHGGRQLDGVPASIDVLDDIVQCVGGGGEVLMDGGVRRGVDMLRALALGAKACLVGRPYLYGLADSGADGVVRSVELLRGELELAMRLAGCAAIKDVGTQLVRRPGGPCDSWQLCV